MSVVISNGNKQDYVCALSEEIRNDIMIEVEASLNEAGLEGDEYQEAWNNAFNSRVSDLEDTIDIKYEEENLLFYVVENLRFQQDKTGGFNITRYDKLQDALMAFAEMPREYTSALGGTLGVREIDFVHRINGENVQINDFKSIEHWDNPLVHRAVDMMKSRLGIEYESDLKMFRKSVLVPVQEFEKPKLNSYFMDKYLRPREGVEKEIRRKYGDPAMYGPTDPMHYEHLYSAINEVFVGGKGWMKAEKFFKKLNSIREYDSPERLKVMKLNINYIDLNGRVGQADINPSDFALLKNQTIERTAQHPDIDVQIDTANKIRMEQMENKGKNKSKQKEMSDPER